MLCNLCTQMNAYVLRASYYNSNTYNSTLLILDTSILNLGIMFKH